MTHTRGGRRIRKGGEQQGTRADGFIRRKAQPILPDAHHQGRNKKGFRNQDRNDNRQASNRLPAHTPLPRFPEERRLASPSNWTPCSRLPPRPPPPEGATAGQCSLLKGRAASTSPHPCLICAGRRCETWGPGRIPWLPGIATLPQL